MRLNHKNRKWIGIIIVGVFFFQAFSNLGCTQKTEYEAGGASWKKILEAEKSMTNAQWYNFRDGLIGKNVKWIGYVADVEGAANRYRVSIVMDKSSRVVKIMNSAFGDIDYFEIPKSKALSLKQKQKIKFSGIIESISKSTMPGSGISIKLNSARLVD